MTSALDKRLANLETEAGGEVIVIWRHWTETAEPAKARWITQHPGRDLNKAGRVPIFGWSAPEPDAPQVQA